MKAIQDSCSFFYVNEYLSILLEIVKYKLVIIEVWIEF